jgi:uncharacterized membrane protein
MTELRCTAAIEIDRPADEVWRVVADYARDAEWRTAVIAMVPSPAGLVREGTTTTEDLRVGGRRYHSDGVVTAVEPGARFTWHTTAGADASGSRSVEALGPDRCRVRLELTVRPSGLERLLRPVLAPVLRANLRADAAHLRDLVEAVPAAA